jgi:hypothetical protein
MVGEAIMGLGAVKTVFDMVKALQNIHALPRATGRIRKGYCTDACVCPQQFVKMK